MVPRRRLDACDLPGPQQVLRGRRPRRRCFGCGLGRDLGPYQQELRPSVLVVFRLGEANTDAKLAYPQRLTHADAAVTADAAISIGSKALRNRWSILAVLFVVRLTMAFQFQSVASVAPLLGREFGV